MKENTKQVLNALEKLTASLTETKDLEKSNEEFMESVSLEMLKLCLVDKDLDADDIAMVHEMMMYFFDYKVDSN